MEGSSTFDKKRLETFVDAILAIILTILVLEFRVPLIDHPDTASLQHSLEEMFPAVFSYVISFMTVVSLWIDHHYLLRSMKSTDKNFAILNMIFLLTLSPLPFTNEFAGTYIHVPFAVVLVAANYTLMNIGFGLLWAYASSKRLLPDDFFTSAGQKKQMWISIVGFVLLGASIPLAYVNTYVPFALFSMVIILHLTKK